MDFSFTPEQEKLRFDIGEFFDENHNLPLASL